MMAVHHSYKNGIECIWKQHVKLYEWSEGGERGIEGGQGEGEGVRKVGQVQLGRAAAAAWTPAQRTRAVCGWGGRGVQAKTQSATCLGEGGCHNLQQRDALPRLLLR